MPGANQFPFALPLSSLSDLMIDLMPACARDRARSAPISASVRQHRLAHAPSQISYRPFLITYIYCLAKSPVLQRFDPSQLPTVHGVVAHYTLLPHGAIDGFILQDSTQVLAVPLFSHEL